MEFKGHNIHQDEFKEFKFYTHNINGVMVSLDNGKNVRFAMTGEDSNKSVGDWNGVGLAKVKLEDKETIRALESTNQFKKGEIKVLPSPNEIAFKKKQEDGLKFVENLKSMFGNGFVNEPELSKMKLPALQSLANQCGVSAFRVDENYNPGKEKTVKELQSELKKLIFGDEDDEENS